MNAFARRGSSLACLMLCAWSAQALAQTTQDPGEDLDSTAFSYPVVITPTRLKQSLADVPAAVTVISGDTIRRYGIRTIPDALRMVPGMAVTQVMGNDYRINYHGTDLTAPRRMNVLIDGFAVYGASLSYVQWGNLPVAMEDIDRIEVTRGPDSAAYGPNSMNSVINIITRSPRDVERAMVSLEAGSHGTAEATARLAIHPAEGTHIALTADGQRDSGYDHTSTDPSGNAHDSSHIQRVNVRSHTDVDGATSLDVYGSVKSSRLEQPYASDPGAQSYPDVTQEESSLAMRWTHAVSASHELQVRALWSGADTRQSWASCYPQLLLHPAVIAVANAHPELAAMIAHGYSVSSVLSNPGAYFTVAEQMQILSAINDIAAANNTTITSVAQALTYTSCGVTNNDFGENRSQVEMQDTYVVSDQLRLVGGGGLRRQHTVSQTFLGGAVDSTVRWLFGHAEYRWTPDVMFNAGGYAESNSQSGASFSPRLAVNVHLSDTQTVRAAWSRGTRSPDVMETRGDWTPSLDQLSPPVAGHTLQSTLTVLRGNPNLQEERNTTLEVGHMLVLKPWGMVIDTRLFDERLSNLITTLTEPTQLSPNNEAHVRLMGAETQLNWTLDAAWSGWLAYSYLVNQDAYPLTERTQWSRQSGSIGLSHNLSDSWQTSLASYWSSGDGDGEQHYGRTDLTLIHTLRLGDTPATAAITASYLHNRIVGFDSAVLRGYQSSYDQRLGVFAKVRLTF